MSRALGERRGAERAAQLSRYGLKTRHPSQMGMPGRCRRKRRHVVTGKGGKAQKIGLKNQARPLVRPHIPMARRGGSRVGERAPATQGACGSPQVQRASLPPVLVPAPTSGRERAAERAHGLHANDTKNPGVSTRVRRIG